MSVRFLTGLTQGQTGLLCELFEEAALSSSCRKEKDGWDFLWTFAEQPDEASLYARLSVLTATLDLPQDSLQKPVIEAIGERDWLAESYQALPPFTVGSFFIYGSHYTGPKPPHQIPLLVEAATAFGSGEHGTTSRCLMAMEYLKDSGLHPQKIIDMGCGSGILAIAAAKLWPDSTIWAADNDPECVRVSKRHAQENNTTAIDVYESEGFTSAKVQTDRPYDLILANILAGPLIAMAGDLSSCLAKGGYVVLSGTLTTQADTVEAAYQQHGLETVKLFEGGEWTTLLMRRS